MSNHSVLRSSAIMAAGTTLSRVTGLVRNLFLVAALGTAIIGDTYQVANTIPTIVYILVAGGALNAVFVPQIVREMKGADGGRAYTSQLVTATITILGLTTAIGILLAPWLVRLYAAKFGAPGLEPEFELTVLFTRYCLPQVLFLGFFTVLGQIANARGSFGPMMWAPIANNVIVIGVLGAFIAIAPQASDGVMSTNAKVLLGLGTSVGALIQALVLIPVITRTGLRLRPNFRWSSLKKSAHLATWTMIFVLINQLGFMVIVNLATAVSVRAKNAGIDVGVGFTPYQNAYFILLLPHSVIAVSFVTALLPRISRLAADRNLESVNKELQQTLSQIRALIIPSAVAMFFLGEPIAQLIFAGSNDADARQIGIILSGFALGLIPFCTSYLLLRGFYAFEDTKTPAAVTLLMNLVTISAASLSYFILPIRWITVGIAASFGVGYLASSLWARKLLAKQIGPMHQGRESSLMLLSAFLAFLPGLILSRYLHTGLWNSLFCLLLSAGIAIPIYLGFGRIFGLLPIITAWDSIRSKITRER